MADISTIGIVGAGQMGNGIAHVGAQAGFRMVMFDAFPEALKKGQDTLAKNMAREVKKEKLTEAERDAALGRVSTTEALSGLGDADLVIEAVTENLDLKLELYEQIGKHLKADALFASNTSSISITRLAKASPNPARFVGVHFFNPVPMMALVELIRGMATSEATFAAVRGVVEKMGKVPVEAKDSPGFIVNRILCPMMNEAVFALQEGLGSVEDIDNGMKKWTRTW